MRWLYDCLDMELTKFDKSSVRKGTPMTQWLVNVNLKSGGFYLNDLVRLELDLKNGQEVLVAKDEKSNKWYITFDSGLQGFRLHKLSNQGGHQDRLCFISRRPAHLLLNEVRATRAATFMLAKNPTTIDDHKWYRIITTDPVRVS